MNALRISYILKTHPHSHSTRAILTDIKHILDCILFQFEQSTLVLLLFDLMFCCHWEHAAHDISYMYIYCTWTNVGPWLLVVGPTT